MVYNHTVKVNGEYYLAGEDIPEQKKAVKPTLESYSGTELEAEPVKRGRPKKKQG